MVAISRWLLPLVLGLLVVGLAVARPAAGDDFRVENSVFAENQQQPESRSTTIFAGGLVYDFLDRPPEAIVLDQAAGRFTLLDLQRRVRTELPMEDVAAFSRQLKQWAAQHKDDPLLRFMAEPSFQEQFDPKTRRLTLKSPWLTYELQLTDPGGGSAVAQYHDFSDWYYRLNVLLNPGSRPPLGPVVGERGGGASPGHRCGGAADDHYQEGLA